ncbi:inositol monophosphatase family protein [Propionibacterium australiense]|uniref:Histidinol-phosphatase n=1 Tax=Propionibacterium australiense TaxID=119981 RepID=A0A383S343_9ACTN|nr:inositol monophosphatase family protein [Propionibacterium australiense]RLP11667.1 histidinol phosphatase [Propionibacterium australiense]RLP12180.1 histidinol phosphatase [Propionibacterium australiense]SYZ32400.1 histidinol-phosphatase [Propionibacterium australiense]VEH90290.1 Histidinol-phosphatase [Propionibacterium australiense]
MAAAPDYTDDLRLAHLMADNADSLTLNRFKARDLKVRAKADHTPVSEADQAVEASVRHTLSTARPRDAVHGEEMPDTGYGPRQWIVDPIDGTANYVRGVPIWATLIGLRIAGEMVVGVVSAPALGRRWWASKGGGAFTGTSLFNPTPIGVSGTSAIPDAFLSYSSIHGWIEAGRGQGFVDLMRDCGRTRAFGDFFSYMLVAEGAVDLACEPDLELYDMAALVPIVTEAGGRFTNLDGEPGPAGPGALATNGILHDEVLARLAPDQDDAES